MAGSFKVAMRYRRRSDRSPPLPSDKDHDVVKHVFEGAVSAFGLAKFANKFQNRTHIDRTARYGPIL
ncbi:hypothetical protein EB230_23190 [Mesorhizobium sp. NZP2234]|nr:hypothetical protein EB230_23190 [Mesorhizobium sp. NZP2234]